MLENQLFSAGETVLIRFRLYSDELAKGWGWAIDNLRVQSLITGIDQILDESTVKVYPNPSFGNFTLEARFKEPVTSGQIRVTNLLGKILFSKSIVNGQTTIDENIDLSALPNGIYLVSIEAPQGRVVKKIMKSN